MELKYISWTVIVVGIFLNLFGIFGCLAIVLSSCGFLLGFLCVLYLQHESLDTFLAKKIVSNPLDKQKTLGLNLACDKKPILIISPNVKVATESKKTNKFATASHDSRKKSLIDSGIEMIFKKHHRHQTTATDDHSSTISLASDLKFRPDIILDSSKDSSGSGSISASAGSLLTADEKKSWKPFESIKIYTERRRSHDVVVDPLHNKLQVTHHNTNTGDGFVIMGEECSGGSGGSAPRIRLTSDESLLDEHGSPKKSSKKTMLSGNKQTDQLLHTFIDYILRDYIDSWFCSLSDNKEFSEFRARNCMEESVQNLCNLIKNTQWIPLMTTKLVDNIATHSRLYRLGCQASSSAEPVAATKESTKQKLLSPQKRSLKKDQHRRNKSDTDLSWYLGGNCSATATPASHKNVANSKFYTATKPVDENTLIDPEAKLLNAFFDNSDLYKDECLSEIALEKHLTHVMETLLYFTLPEEDFACLPLRTFLATLLANVVCKPALEMLADPDFINLQVARLVAKEPPPADIFLKLIRQCTDLSELRACRQYITKEMDQKYKDSNSSAELNSLKYTQKLIDLRLSYLQSNKSEMSKSDRDKSAPANLPILTLDELLTKELALSYYLDYLSILNLQKYVIFYLTAQEWKLSSNRCLQDLHSNKMKSTRDEILKSIRDKASHICKEYLQTGSANCLNIDAGLIEALSIKIRDTILMPDGTWFDSICKFVYEKLKNEDVFLNNFYQSSAYKKLLLELECYSHNPEPIDIDPAGLASLNLNFDTGSDSNSGDLPFDDELDEELELEEAKKNTINENQLLDVINFKHSRSHSDCTGLLQNMSEIRVGSFQSNATVAVVNDDNIQSLDEPTNALLCAPAVNKPRAHSAPASSPTAGDNRRATLPISSEPLPPKTTMAIALQPFLSAKIINTAIHCEGQYAVYAIQVSLVESNQHKSWHIYRRYSKFLELKKMLVKKYANISNIPFPAKKTFQNTQRSVLEHRMNLLNEFLKTICQRAETCDEIRQIVRQFVEPDMNDRKLHSGSGIRTIETIVNPFKTGMRTIINMPDTLVGGIAKILLGKGPLKEPSFLDVTPIHLEQSSEYPALTSALNLLDEVFDLQARSQWLRRGIINRLLGALWVSHAANKKIIHAAKGVIEIEKIDHLLSVILNSIWPDGKQYKRPTPREDNTKLRTRMAAKVALFALLSDDLKHVVGSETTRHGLLTLFTMWQNRKLNLRLLLVLFNDILTTLYQIDSLTKHVAEK